MISLAISIFLAIFVLPYLIVSWLAVMAWIIEKLFWQPIEQITDLCKKLFDKRRHRS